MAKITTAAALKAALKRASDDLKKDMTEKIIKKLALDGYKAVVDGSAYQYGYLRSNWDVAIDTPPPEDTLTPEEGKTYPPPPDPDLSATKYNSRITLYNNTLYAAYVEDGTEKMEAQPTVAPAALKMLKQAEALCKALSKKKYD